ncbi:CBS domain-containing protein [Candidatus Woesearchaeota archaeon]|nr:CBS domain-containing protein [Candidatus Woesearchaeota archaeon]
MVIDISEIKHIRKKLGLTQNDLAKLSGVSQSLIAKIEADTLDPAYTNAKKIFNALESFSRKKDIKADEIMTPKLVFVSPSDSAKDAIKKMKRHEISQMPVIDNGRAVGMISEAILLDAVLNGKADRIEDIMDDAPPVLSKDSSVNVISDILRYYPLVLIGKRGNIKGIITKSDLLRKVYNK